MQERCETQCERHRKGSLLACRTSRTAFKSISGASLLYFDPDEWETGKGNGEPCICCEKFNKALVQIPNRQRGPTKGTTLILPRKIVYTAGSFGGLSVGNLTSTAYFTSRDPKSNLVQTLLLSPQKGSSYTDRKRGNIPAPLRRTRVRRRTSTKTPALQNHIPFPSPLFMCVLWFFFCLIFAVSGFESVLDLLDPLGPSGQQRSPNLAGGEPQVVLGPLHVCKAPSKSWGEDPKKMHFFSLLFLSAAKTRPIFYTPPPPLLPPRSLSFLFFSRSPGLYPFRSSLLF